MSDAHNLLFGPRRRRQRDNKVPRIYFTYVESGQIDVAASYLVSREKEIATNPELHDLAAAIVAQTINRYNHDDSPRLYQLRETANSVALDIGLSDEEGDREIQVLTEHFLANLDDPNHQDTIISGVWNSDNIGPGALAILEEESIDEEAKPRLDALMGTLMLGYRRNNPGPLFHSLSRDLNWRLLQEAEELGCQFLRDLGLLDEKSNVFATEGFDFHGGLGNTLHIRDGEQFLCHAPAENIRRALRGAWREVPRFQDNPDRLYSRCPICENYAEDYMTPACEEMSPSLLSQEEYDQAISFVEGLTRRIYIDYDKQIAGEKYPDLDELDKQAKNAVFIVVHQARANVLADQRQAIARRVAETMVEEHEKDDLCFLDRLWGLEVVDNYEDHILAINPPDEAKVEEWLSTTFDADNANNFFLPQMPVVAKRSENLKKILSDHLAKHFSLEDEVTAANLRRR